MSKSKKIPVIIQEQVLRIGLPTGIVVVGPGTVPTSTASVSQTSIKNVTEGFKRASKFRIFDDGLMGA